ncbi:hypothetical protein [Nocardioides sp. MH1]|uniref:hypothetical protein n=1 Tax=Nocardioides sp. MH1 TaxID=3242490 RepID=UPI003522BFA2
MTGSPHHFPPPGAPLPEEPAGGPPPGAPYAPPPPAPPFRGGPPAPPGMLGAAHKPGAFALRPLRLGDMYDGAFRIIRFNPKATVGAAALVTAVAMILPIAVNAVLAFTVGSGFDTDGEISDEPSTTEALGLIGGFGSLLLGSYVAQLGLILVTGMVVHVTRAAAVGRRLTLAEAWAATHGKRWRLVGQTFVVAMTSLFVIAVAVLLVVLVAVATGDVLVTVLISLLVVAATVPVCMWLWIKLVLLATPALMLEPIGVFAAFGRSWRLTGGQFWRVLGIALLTVLITGTAGQIVGFPFGIVAGVGGALAPQYYFLIYSIATGVGAVLSNAFVAPFTAAVTSLQYIDQRMRKEAYDVELMREAGLIAR